MEEQKQPSPKIRKKELFKRKRKLTLPKIKINKITTQP